mmetsp:Transcript_83983/g.228068  ORF Transcript_83983/g.228068 Transcript_83983/m.228068 type:complete len:203 (+) Transcript_83983:606-1214(+)
MRLGLGFSETVVLAQMGLPLCTAGRSRSCPTRRSTKKISVRLGLVICRGECYTWFLGSSCSKCLFCSRWGVFRVASEGVDLIVDLAQKRAIVVVLSGVQSDRVVRCAIAQACDPRARLLSRIHAADCRELYFAGQFRLGGRHCHVSFECHLQRYRDFLVSCLGLLAVVAILGAACGCQLRDWRFRHHFCSDRIRKGGSGRQS